MDSKTLQEIIEQIKAEYGYLNEQILLQRIASLVKSQEPKIVQKNSDAGLKNFKKACVAY